jgi:hypothetical protein
MTSSTLVAMTTCPASSASDELIQQVSANVADVRSRIASAGREPQSVRIVAVTKTFAPQMVRAAYEAGLRTIGENYVDELTLKRSATADIDLEWYYMGALQTNKISRVLEVSDVLCGVSRVKELNRIAAKKPGATIFVEVNCTDLTTRHGAPPSEVAALVEHARQLGVNVRGLMTVAPTDVKGAREAFHITSELADELGLRERSMGMSDDLELACEYGTTEVRVGRALFGPRVAP